jgi:hypothetical protein
MTLQFKHNNYAGRASKMVLISLFCTEGYIVSRSADPDPFRGTAGITGIVCKNEALKKLYSIRKILSYITFKQTLILNMCAL